MRYGNVREEILRLMDKNHLSVLEMASKIKMSYNGLRRILDSKEDLIVVQKATLRNIADAFGCEIEEKGQRIYFVDNKSDEMRIAEEIASYGNRPDIQELLREIYSLPKAEQDEMWQIVDSIIKLRKSGKK